MIGFFLWVWHNARGLGLIVDHEQRIVASKGGELSAIKAKRDAGATSNGSVNTAEWQECLVEERSHS